MITLSQLKTKSISTVSTLMGLSIVKLSGKRKQNYYLADVDGTFIGFLGRTRIEVTQSLASCFTKDELGTTNAPIEEEAKNFLFPLFELDSIQNGKYRNDLTGHDSICDYIRSCYLSTFEENYVY